MKNEDNNLHINESKETKAVREYLENIIALMPGHVYWKDKNGVYLGCNDLQFQDAGLSSKDELIGNNDYEMPWKEQADSLRRIDIEVMTTGVPHTVEELSTLANGTNAIFLTQKVPLIQNNEIVGVLGISFDITEQKRLEQELADTHHKLAGMTLLAATIAHEIRTPLASINIGLENMHSIIRQIQKITHETTTQDSRDLTTPKFQNVSDMFKALHNEIRSATTFIDMLLMNVNPTPDNKDAEVFSMSACVNEALLRYPFKSNEKKVILFREEEDFKVKGKQILLIHVLFNLIKNALYYVAKAGSGDITIWLEPGKENHKLFFKDTGTGIPAADLPHIFDRFFSRTHHGAGIGLTFCKSVMESLEGSITCDSKQNEYTIFILSFPNIE